MAKGTARPREAVVLAAGRGTRLRPLTRSCPKCLVGVGGQPMMKRLMGQLEAVGIERVVVVTGHHRQMVQAALDAWSPSMVVEVAFNPHFRRANNAVSLARALETVDRDGFLLCDGDVILRSPRYLERLLDAPGRAVIGYRRMRAPPKEAMKVEVGGDDARIRRFGKSLPAEHADGESLGIQKIGAALVEPLARCLDGLDEARRRDWYYEDAFAQLVRRGIEVIACELPGDGWMEIDTPTDLERARRLVKRWDGNG